jgi:uncharacterized protein
MPYVPHSSFARLPWANGRGITQEAVRIDRPEGGILWRISLAEVNEDGPFSDLPGLHRTLTVVAGPGFLLTWPDRSLSAQPFVPVTFAGDPAPVAREVVLPCRDVNLMVWDGLPRPEVAVMRNGPVLPPPGGVIAVVALAPARIGVHDCQPFDLVWGKDQVQVSGGAALVAQIALQPLAGCPPAP